MPIYHDLEEESDGSEHENMDFHAQQSFDPSRPLSEIGENASTCIRSVRRFRVTSLMQPTPRSFDRTQVSVMIVPALLGKGHLVVTMLQHGTVPTWSRVGFFLSRRASSRLPAFYAAAW